MRRFDARELEIRHQTLDRAIHELDRRGNHMTPEDRDRAIALKRQRLATKDQLESLRRN